MPIARVSTSLRRRRANLAAATCALAVFGGAGQVAHAQEPGVIYEPGSPSGKEYAIPLEEARRDGGGARVGAADARAFGIGISRRGGAAKGSRGGGAASSRGSDARPAGSQANGGGSPASDRRGVSAGLQERLDDAETAGAPAFWKLAPLLLVLLPGLIVGLLLARRGGQTPAT